VPRSSATAEEAQASSCQREITPEARTRQVREGSLYAVRGSGESQSSTGCVRPTACHVKCGVSSMPRQNEMSPVSPSRNRQIPRVRMVARQKCTRRAGSSKVVLGEAQQRCASDRQN